MWVWLTKPYVPAALLNHPKCINVYTDPLTTLLQNNNVSQIYNSLNNAQAGKIIIQTLSCVTKPFHPSF